ncbi:MAG: STAS domain-containing protein [Myxococcales bacterium FL481]|nr:MAG: STAS domain-containing protein [Myxococcales bacterium FL481]
MTASYQPVRGLTASTGTNAVVRAGSSGTRGGRFVAGAAGSRCHAPPLGPRPGPAVEPLRPTCHARVVWCDRRPEDDGTRLLATDALAGVTLAVMLVPQTIAYASLAGLPPQVGLYAATLPAFAYGLTGTNRFLSMGPVAVVSLLIASGLSELATPGSAEYRQYAVTLATLVAGLYLLLALVRAGFLVNFLSRPTTVGFNAGAAVLTVMSQVAPILGLSPAEIEGFSSTWPWPVFGHIGLTRGMTAVVGGGALLVLIGLPRVWRKAPGPLIVCGLGILGTQLTTLDVDVVGYVPRGFPTLALPTFALADVRALFPTALSIVMVGYISSMTVGTALARKARVDLDANRELLAFGAANLGAALCGAFPVSAGLARAAALYDAGARSRLAAPIAATVVLAVLVAFAPAIAGLPRAILAAMVMVAASRLIDVSEIRALVRGRPDGWLTMAMTFAATLVLGLEEGLVVGVCVSLALFIRRTAAPHSAELGRLPGTTIYRNLDRFAAQPCPQAPILRIDAPLYFGNAAFLEQRIHQLFVDSRSARLAVLDFAAVNDLDATALQALRRAVRSHRERGAELHLVAVIGPVRDILHQSGLDTEIGEERLHRTLHEAVPRIMGSVDATYCRQHCRNAAFVACDRLQRGPPTVSRKGASQVSRTPQP